MAAYKIKMAAEYEREMSLNEKKKEAGCVIFKGKKL